MQGSFLIEIFQRDFTFLNKTMLKAQKYEFDYISLENNTLTIPGYFEANKNNYIRIISKENEFQGVITSVEYKAKETKIQYKTLLSLLDVDVYMNRKRLSEMTVEKFLGLMIEENFQNNEDELQNIPGIQIEITSQTENGALNLKDNIHNIYDTFISAFSKYEIVIDMKLNIMEKSLLCTIGVQSYDSRTIECDLKNILETNIVLKDDSESVNKVIIVGEYNQDSELYGQTIERIYYKDKLTGATTLTPSERVTPVVFKVKVLEIDEETFEDDAYQEAYDLIYHEKHDNYIKVKLSKTDPLHDIKDFSIGQTCTIIKKGQKYITVYTGYVLDTTVTLMFGIIRTEYTKNRRKS